MSLDTDEPIARILDTPSAVECSQNDIARNESIKQRLFSLPRTFRYRLPPAVYPGKPAFLHMSLHVSLSHIWQMKAVILLSLFCFVFSYTYLVFPGWKLEIVYVHLPQSETTQSTCFVSFRKQRGETFIFIIPNSINNYSSLDLNKKSPTDMGS